MDHTDCWSFLASLDCIFLGAVTFLEALTPNSYQSLCPLNFEVGSETMLYSFVFLSSLLKIIVNKIYKMPMVDVSMTSIEN
jgi:hypothetical protein